MRMHTFMPSAFAILTLPISFPTLGADLAIIRALAEKYIREELHVPDEMDVHRSRNRLTPLFGYMRDGTAARLGVGRSVGKNSLGLSGLVVDICVWPRPPGEHLKGLVLQVLGAYDGIAQVSALNSAQTLELVFLFDFTKDRAHPDIESSGFKQPLAKGRAEEAVALIEYRKAVLGNQIVEIVLPNGGKIECEVVIPCNVDIGGTFQAWDQEIERMRAWARS